LGKVEKKKKKKVQNWLNTIEEKKNGGFGLEKKKGRCQQQARKWQNSASPVLGGRKKKRKGFTRKTKDTKKRKDSQGKKGPKVLATIN